MCIKKNAHKADNFVDSLKMSDYMSHFLSIILISGSALMFDRYDPT